MTADPYPEHIEFEIDRPALLRYLRLRGVLGCSAASVVFGLWMGLMTFGANESGRYRPEPRPSREAFAQIVTHLSVGLAGGLLLGGILYFVVCHVPTGRRAKNLRLLVEGPYLRLVYGAFNVRDRRIHFRAISDYSTSDGPLLRRLGMKSLSFHILGTGNSSGSIVYGLVDAQRVRDQLCEIDAVRER